MWAFLTSEWFWFAAVAYIGVNWGGYIASKDPAYHPLGGVAVLTKIALYILVLILFWRLDKWYYALIVFVFLFLCDLLFTNLHTILHMFLRKESSANEYRILGVVGTLVGIVFTVLSYISMFKTT